MIDEKARQAIVYVNKNTMLNKITVKDLKLGPISSTVSPDFITLKDFTQEQKVNVTFKGKTKSGVCTHSSRIRLSLLIRRMAG